MPIQTNAALFAPPLTSVPAAERWLDEIQAGHITSFRPIHGKVAGFHVVVNMAAVPLQKIPLLYQRDQETPMVRVTKVNHVHGCTIQQQTEGSVLCYPHLNLDIEWDDK